MRLGLCLWVPRQAGAGGRGSFLLPASEEGSGRSQSQPQRPWDQSLSPRAPGTLGRAGHVCPSVRPAVSCCAHCAIPVTLYGTPGRLSLSQSICFLKNISRELCPYGKMEEWCPSPGAGGTWENSTEKNGRCGHTLAGISGDFLPDPTRGLQQEKGH